MREDIKIVHEIKVTDPSIVITSGASNGIREREIIEIFGVYGKERALLEKLYRE